MIASFLRFSKADQVTNLFLPVNKRDEDIRLRSFCELSMKLSTIKIVSLFILLLIICFMSELIIRFNIFSNDSFKADKSSLLRYNSFCLVSSDIKYEVSASENIS